MRYDRTGTGGIRPLSGTGAWEALPRESAVGEVNPRDTPIRYIVWGVILTHIGLEFPVPAIPDAYDRRAAVPTRASGRCGGAARGSARHGRWPLAELVWQGCISAFWSRRTCRRDHAPSPLAFVHGGGDRTALRAAGGLRRVYEQAGVAPEGDPLRSAVVWQLMCVALALSPLSHSWLAGIPMLVAFVVIVKAMFRISDGLGDAGYCLTAAPVQVSGKRFGWCYVALCAALVVGGSLWVNHPRLDAQPRPTPEMAAERQALAALGMPENVAADLSDEHVAVLEGALYVKAFRNRCF